MKYVTWLRHGAVALAALGIVLPTQILRAEQPLASAPQQQSVVVDVPDVKLGNNGLLRGVVVDAQGRAMASSTVVVRQGANELVRTATNKDGQFAVVGLKGGVYQVASNNGNMSARLWNQESAPPAAKDSIMLVNSQQVIRAQDLGDLNWMEWTLLGAVIATAITVPIVVGTNNDNNNESSS